MGGGAFHPRRKRQSRGRGGKGGLHSGPRPQTWVASGWTREGCRQRTHASGIRFGHCWGQTMDWTPSSQPGSSIFPFSVLSEERNQKD